MQPIKELSAAGGVPERGFALIRQLANAGNNGAISVINQSTARD